MAFLDWVAFTWRALFYISESIYTSSEAMVFLTINILVRMLGVVDVTGGSELALKAESWVCGAHHVCRLFWDEPEAYKYRAEFWF